MSDSTAASNAPVLTVSEISRALKRTVEDAYSYVRVRGEISGFKRAASGHMYLALKDEEAVLDGVCWRGTAQRLGLQPEDGLEVICTGRLTTYPGRSKYQIVIEQMELAGEGALLKLLEERKKKLAAEGLFDEARKQPLPFLPEVIGVVTSPTGAVIRDILHRLADRFPRHVLLWPVLVQGEGAADQVAAAISGFNALPRGGPVPRPDLLIVARGGGSIEDLWAFNEEVVARAAADSKIPLISAVGHETDFTLIDFVADQRAPTPTAAAEMAVPVRAELVAQVLDDAQRLVRASERLITEHRVRLEGLARGLPDPSRLVEVKAQKLDDEAERLSKAIGALAERRGREVLQLGARLREPRELVSLAGQRTDHLGGRLERAFGVVVRAADQRLGAAGQLLESLSYKSVLNRGYAVVRDEVGDAVMSAAKLQPDAVVEIEMHDGRAPATIGGEKSKRRPAARRAKSAPSDPSSQGRLL